MIDYIVILNKLVRKTDLNEAEASAFMRDCMENKIPHPLVAGILTALCMKKESADEITAFAKVMRSKCKPLTPKRRIVVDCVGSGGDYAGSFNISTAAGLLVAASGIMVAKHGNRSVTSKCGSADVIEKLGVDLGASPEKLQQVLDQVGFTFLFAPTFHFSMKNVVSVRKLLGIRTVFNCLGPITNPAKANVYLVGFYSRELTENIAESLKNLGALAFHVVHGESGLDEVSNTGKTYVIKMGKDKKIENFVFDPTRYGFSIYHRENLEGGNAEKNAQIIRDIFTLKEHPAKIDATIINAGFAISSAKNVSLEEGFKIADKTLRSGKAGEFLNTYIVAAK